MGRCMRHKLPIALLNLAIMTLLSACATPRTETPSVFAEQEQAATWFALGTEPFWTVEITPATIRFHAMEGRSLTVANPGARPSFNGERYVTSAIIVDVTHAPCNDGMSDRRYADSVIVTMGAETLRGCGGRVLPPNHLDGTNWRIISIDGAPVDGGQRPAEIRFAGDRIQASVGCNQMNGRFSSDGTRLTVSQLASTRMACAPELMQREARLSALLGQSLALRVDGRGRLTLTGNDDATVILERIM